MLILVRLLPNTENDQDVVGGDGTATMAVMMMLMMIGMVMRIALKSGWLRW